MRILFFLLFRSSQRNQIEMDEWNCPNCTLVNSKELNECAACANRRPATNGNSFSSTLAIRRFTDMQPPATPSLVWRCSICSGENDNGSAVCVLCQNPSPSWICPICTLSNRKQSPMCVVCGANNPFINDRQVGFTMPNVKVL